jgi:hypothetical protein
MIASLIVFVMSVILSWLWLPDSRGTGNVRPTSLEAKFLLVVTALYAVPLPIAVLLGNEGGSLSIYMDDFAPWLPSALYFTSGFLLFFVGFYRWFYLRDRKVSSWCAIKSSDTRRFKLIWLAVFGVSIISLELLARDVGGILALMLSGYHVTELFVGQGHFAVAFEWLLSLSVVLMSYGIMSKKTTLVRSAWVFGVVLFAMLFVMGRRGMLAVMILAFAYLAIEAGWIVRLRRFLLPGMILFIVLNWLGLVRGESYSDFLDLTSVLFVKTADLSDSGELEALLFYTLTHGNFVVSFETLPQIMRNLAQSWDYWLGWSIPRSLALIVPMSIMPDRPLPLSNWYMDVFYGGTSSSNEGRQFFFLGEAYLNFGWLGCAIWGLVIAIVFWLFSRPRSRGLSYWELALRALFFGSLLNFVASDTTGFFVAFFKGFGLVPIVFALLGTRRTRNEAA